MEEDNIKLSHDILNVEFYIKEIKYLKERVENLTDDNFHLKEENLSLSNQVEIKFQESIFKSKKIETLQNENGELRNKLEELSKNNQMLENDNLHFLDMKKCAEEREITLKNELKELSLLNDNLKEELKKEKIYSINLNNKISDMERANNIIQKELNFTVTEKNQLKHLKEQVESELKQAVEDSLFNKNIQNNEKMFFEKNKLQLNNKIIALNEEISTLNQNNLIKSNQLEMRLKTLEKQNEEFNLENKDLLKKIEIKEKNNSDLFELINKIQNEMKSKESLIRFLEDLVNEKEEIIISRKSKIIELSKELDMFRNTEKKLLSSEISFKGRELFNDEIILKRENEKLKQELEIFCSKYNKLIEMNNQLKSKLNILEEKINALEDLNKNVTEKNNQLELNYKLLEHDKNDCFNYNILLSKQNKELMLRFNLINDKTLEKKICDKQNYEHLISCKVDEYETNINKMLFELGKMKEILDDKDETIDDLNKVIELQKKEIRDIEERYKKMINEEEKAFDLENKKYTIRTYNLTDPNISLDNYKKIEKFNQELLHDKSILTEKLNEYISKLNIYENDLIETNNKNLSLKKEIIEKEKFLMNYSYEIEKLTFNNREYQEKLSSLEKNMESKNSEINTLRQGNFNLNNEKVSFREKLDNLFLESNNKLSQIQKTFEEKVNFLVNENNSLKEILMKFFNTNEIVGDMQQLNQSPALHNYIENIKKQNEIISKKESVINNLNQQILEYTLQIDNLQTFNSNLKAKFEITENQLKTLTKSIYQHKQVHSTENQTTQLIKEPEDTDSNFDRKVYEKYLISLKKIDEYLTQNNYLKSKITELENFNKDLISNNYHSSYKFLLLRIEELNQNNDELRTKLSKLTNDSEEFNKILVEIKIEKENLIQQRTNYEQDISSLKNHLANANNLTQEKENQIQDLKNQLIESQKKEVIIINLEKERENLIKEKNNLNKEIEKSNAVLTSEKENFQKELENLKNINNLHLEELNKNKDLNVKSFSEREKELKEDYDKKLVEARSKAFSHFFAVFKKAKNTIESLLKVEKSLQEKISNIDDISNCNIPLTEYKSKIGALENQIISFKKRIKDLEFNLDDKTKKYNYEIELVKVREEKLINEIKVIKSIQDSQKNEEAKPENEQRTVMFNRLLKSLYNATNVITVMEMNDKTMKAEIERLKGDVDRKHTLTSCENCTSMKEESRHLNEVISNLKNQISKDKNEIGKVSNLLLKNEIEKSIIYEDCKMFSTLINQKLTTNIAQIDPSDKSRIENEKNKNFNLLLVYMKKSSKLINALTEEIRILQGKLENLK